MMDTRGHIIVTHAIATDDRACMLYVAMVSGTVGRILCGLGQGQAVRMHTTHNNYCYTNTHHQVVIMHNIIITHHQFLVHAT